jgi:hypothetical protein
MRDHLGSVNRVRTDAFGIDDPIRTIVTLALHLGTAPTVSSMADR